MMITVKLFAALRERAGAGHRELQLAAGACVADVWPALDIGEGRPDWPTPEIASTRPATSRWPTATRWP